MKSRIYLKVLLVGLILFTGLVQENVFLGNFQNPPEFIENWRADLTQFVSNYTSVFPDPFGEISEADFNAAVERLHDAIPTLSTNEITVEFMKLVALVEDGHTWLLPHQDATGYSMLPLRVYHFSDGLFVTDADENYRDMIGGEVIRIGNTDIETVTSALNPLVSRDNAMTVLERITEYYLFPELLKTLGFIEDAEQVSWTLQFDDGRTETFSISSISADDYFDWIEPAPTNSNFFPTSLPQRETPLYLTRLKENFWMEHLEAPNVLYIQYNAVVDRTVSESGSETMLQFSTRLREFLNGHLQTPVVVDLRHNLGGNVNTFVRFLNILNSHQAFDEPEKLYLILGRRTFSAAVIFTDELRASTDVILVGEPSGGGLNFSADAQQRRLTNSRLIISVSTRPFRTIRDDDLPWHAPDIPINLSSSDFFNEHDPSLEAVFEHLRSM